MKGFICSTPVYEYEGWLFEFHTYLGPCPLTKSGEPRKHIGNKFWDMFDRFTKLSLEEQKTHRVGGGCIGF